MTFCIYNHYCLNIYQCIKSTKSPNGLTLKTSEDGISAVLCLYQIAINLILP